MAEGTEAFDLGFDDLDEGPKQQTRAKKADDMFDDAKKDARNPFEKAFDWLIRGEK